MRSASGPSGGISLNRSNTRIWSSDITDGERPISKIECCELELHFSGQPQEEDSEPAWTQNILLSMRAAMVR